MINWIKTLSGEELVKHIIYTLLSLIFLYMFKKILNYSFGKLFKYFFKDGWFFTGEKERNILVYNIFPCYTDYSKAVISYYDSALKRFKIRLCSEEGVKRQSDDQIVIWLYVSNIGKSIIPYRNEKYTNGSDWTSSIKFILYMFKTICLYKGFYLFSKNILSSEPIYCGRNKFLENFIQKEIDEMFLLKHNSTKIKNFG